MKDQTHFSYLLVYSCIGAGTASTFLEVDSILIVPRNIQEQLGTEIWMQGRRPALGHRRTLAVKPEKKITHSSNSIGVS